MTGHQVADRQRCGVDVNLWVSTYSDMVAACDDVQPCRSRLQNLEAAARVDISAHLGTTFTLFDAPLACVVCCLGSIPLLSVQ
jgi:hypothetical protein